jgi:hypothetical protein
MEINCPLDLIVRDDKEKGVCPFHSEGADPLFFVSIKF